MQKQFSFFQSALIPEVYRSEIQEDGFAVHFRDGVIYHYPGLVPLLEVSSTRFKMGLQYGVLISPEIKTACETFECVFTLITEQMGNSLSDFYEMILRQTLLLLKKLPQRFVQEIQPGNLYQCDQVVTFYVLSAARLHLNPQKAEAPQKYLQELLAEMKAEDHFLKELVLLIERQG